MRLPVACRHAHSRPRDKAITHNLEDDIILCCRAPMSGQLDRCEEPPLCQVEGDEIYRISYDHAFGAHASQGCWFDGYDIIIEGRRRDIFRATC
jgi:hypothetical protein